MMRLYKDVIFNSDGLSQNLAQKSVRGGMATMGSQGIRFLLQMASTMVLARLLTPADFGLIAMVTVVVNFATMFKDAGLSMATVQKDKISHEQISTLFWINVFISVVLGLCVLACSPLVAKFYGKPELGVVTAVLSTSFILSGLSIQHAALLRRHMRFGCLAIIKIASHVITLAVTIALALLGYRYWALVGGSLATALSTAILTFMFCSWIPGWPRKGTGVRGMLQFGMHLTGFGFVNYFSRNADNILIGRFIGVDALGLYSKAYQMFLLPINQIRAPLFQVAMPVLCSLKDQPERYVKYYQRLLDILATLTIPLTIYCALEADFLIRLLLGSQWVAAVSVFRILAIAGLIQAIASTRGLVLISHGFSKRFFYYGAFSAVLCVVSFIVGIPYGIEGVAAAYTISIYLFLIPALFYCFSKTPVTVSLFFKTLFLPLLTGTLAGGGVLLFKHVWPSELFIVHGLSLVLFGLLYIGMSFCRQSIRETWNMFLKRGLSGLTKKARGDSIL